VRLQERQEERKVIERETRNGETSKKSKRREQEVTAIERKRQVTAIEREKMATKRETSISNRVTSERQTKETIYKYKNQLESWSQTP